MLALEKIIDEFAAVNSSGVLSLNSASVLGIIDELIAGRLLLVDNSRELMTLVIKLLCEPSELSAEQRKGLNKFMVAIINEFNEFNAKNNLSNECIDITQDERGNKFSLRITMPTLALYDAFIQSLAANLKSTLSLKIPEPYEVRRNHGFVLSPLSTEPKLYTSVEAKTP